MDSQEWNWIIMAGGTIFRYFFFAGIGYLLFYMWKKRDWYRFRIQQHFPKAGAIRTEIRYSILTLCIFSVVLWAVFSPLRSYTLLYDDLRARSNGYLVLSVLLCIFLHDTYFYWMHRLMHWKKIFRYVHAVHHKSHNPSPWAAYAFHPLEALIAIGIIPLILFTIPVYITAVSIFTFYSIVMNVMGHVGYELYPSRFLRNRWTSWMNTSTHHNMHHKYSKGNYGLYFNIWDTIMKTNHRQYRETFEAVKERARHDAASPIATRTPATLTAEATAVS